MGGTNATEIVDRIGTWNWTASDKVALSVVEKGPATEDGLEKIALIHVCRLHVGVVKHRIQYSVLNREE